MHKAAACFFLAFAACGAEAQTEVRFWHAMDGALGEALESLVERFNASQNTVRVVAERRGDYERTLAAAIEAQRAGAGPELVQVYELGTAQLIAAKGAWRPLWQAAAEAGERIDARQFLPAVAGYFSDAEGRLLALPFNISTPVLFYNRAAFRRAGLDPERPPRTWYEMPRAMGELLEAGLKCAYTTTWPAWVHVENMSTWHRQDFATRDNGLGGLDAKLVFNTHLVVRHVSMLASWARSGYFTYSGRRLEGERRFASGECAMLTASSASYAALKREAQFELGVAPLPYYDDVRGAPHHSLIGGGGLWILAGRPAEQTRGAARFLAFLARPEVQVEWHQRTGFVPVTRAAYERARAQGFYDAAPAHEVAIRQLSLNVPTRESRGIRLGEFAAIRAIVEEALEAAIQGDKPPKLALDEAAARGNALLRRFEAAQRAGAAPAPRAPGRPTPNQAKPEGSGRRSRRQPGAQKRPTAAGDGGAARAAACAAQRFGENRPVCAGERAGASNAPAQDRTMTRSQIRRFVEEASIERIRQVLDGLQALRMHRPIADEQERAFLLDLRDHEAFFRELADRKLQGG